MSYNPNQPYEQWQQQQQPIDPNQQQLQIIDPQAITPSPLSNPAGGGGNYQKSQQSYSWTDGNTQGQHQQSQQSWSWQGQQQIANPGALQSPPPVFSPLLQDNNSHHLLHQQIHQNATSHLHQLQSQHHQQFADVHRNMSTFTMSSVDPIILQNQQQPQMGYQQVASPPPPLMQVQSISQSYFPQQQQQAQIEYQPMSPDVPMQQVQHQNQPMPQGSHLPQQQAQVAYLPMPTLPPVQQVQYQESVRQENLPMAPHEQRNPGLLPPATSRMTLQPQEHHQQGPYQQRPTTQQYAISQLPQSQQKTPPKVLQSPSETRTQRLLQPQPSEQPSQTTLPVASRPNDHRLMSLEKQRKVDVENTNRAGAEINKRLRGLERSRNQAQQDHDAKDREVRRLREQLTSVERQRRQDAECNSQQLADLVRSQATTPASSAGDFDMSALQKVVRETQAHQLTAQDIERVIEEQVSKRMAGMATKQDIQNAGAQMQGALSKVPGGLSQQEVQQAVNRELNNVMRDVANRVNQQRRLGGQGQSNPQSSLASQHQVQTEFVVEELPDNAVATRSHHARHHGSRTQRQLPPAETSGHTAAASLSTTTQRALPSVPTPGATGSNQSSATSNAPAISQRSAVSAPVRAQITAPFAASGLVPQADAAGNTLVPSRKPTPAVNLAPQGPQFRALEASPAAPGVSENRLARVEKSVSRAILPSSDVSSPQNLQRMDAPAAQRQLPAPPAAVRRELLQQPSRSLPQIEPPARQQRQLAAPPAQSEASPKSSQELMLQGREVAKKPPPSKQ
jgi:hypothetical protein